MTASWRAHAHPKKAHPLDVGCPVCGAKAGNPCDGEPRDDVSGGGEWRGAHAARHMVANGMTAEQIAHPIH